MEKTPCQGCRGLCCGPVLITQKELLKIKKKIRSIPFNERRQLEGQHRYYGTCILYDLDNDKCGIYSARPEICRVYGHYKNLTCFRKPDLAASINWYAKENHIGLLSVDVTWKDFK